MKKNISKQKKIVLIFVSIIIFCALAFAVSYWLRFLNYKSQVSGITISSIDLKSVPDGEYYGDCNVDFIYAKVKVTTKNHKITQIELLTYDYDKKAGYGTPAVAVPSIIVKEQTVQITPIAGATNSSKVIMKAVESALLSKPKKN